MARELGSRKERRTRKWRSEEAAVAKELGSDDLLPCYHRATTSRFAIADPQNKERSDHLPMETTLEYPLPSPVSNGPAPADSNVSINWSFFDMFPMGSEDSVSDFGIFSGFDDYLANYFPSSLDSLDEGTTN
uniref:Uncharacterized protein n=1 Tax=Nelumbo nucifera TaxID=4432 RepID=A0A822Y471_NELNU|nr:TPA_asm: hypothetical protein HUJ06_030192 [Nelumbo nucifera]